MAQGRQHFHLAITSELANLGAVADFIAEAGYASGLSEKQVCDVQMAVDEAVTNVMQHAYRGRSDGRIWIDCEQNGGEFSVEIHDFGAAFDVSKIPAPRTRGTLARRAIGGLGVYFMRKLMDRVEFSSDARDGNRVRMVKRIK